MYIQRIWNVKCIITPVIIAVTVIVTEALRQTSEATPGKYSKDSVQKTAILGTSHIIRKRLRSETWKPERWGSPLVQKYKEEMRKQQYNNNNKCKGHPITGHPGPRGGVDV
jgi:hypothetical protein